MARIFANPEGGRLLGSMVVIRNEPSCYTAACHVHTKAQSVLGVLDIVYNLDEIDRTMHRNTITIAGFSLGFIVIASLFVSFFVHRLVYVPLRDLETGAKRLSSGNLEEPIPVRSEDEFGQLAASFNAMTAALRNSQAELREWGHTLEQKVATRTQELRVAEAEAARGEKLASVGLLAAGIAHELNNPLTGILTFSHLLREKMPDGSPEAEDLDLVIRETKRCAAIIRRLLDFAREKAPEKKFADLNQIIEDTVRIIERPAHLRDIEIALDLDRSLPPAWVDADLIKQVIMNVLVNAQHAIEEKGSITVRSRLFPEPKSPEPGAEAVPMAELSVIDTGCGIPEKNLRRIFDPFFTSKEVGKGTGLGLSVSHGIVRAHGGTIEVDSKVGEGSTFRIYLPLNSHAGDAATGNSGSEK
jgi:two-component system NtrC family sensor kinase